MLYRRIEKAYGKLHLLMCKEQSRNKKRTPKYLKTKKKVK